MNEELIYILLAVAIFILYTAFDTYWSPKLLGRLGETRVARKLKRLHRKDYIVHNNIYLNYRGLTTQIDHLVVSIYGIFVIETKNHKGWIFGNERWQYWTQTLYKQKFKFYNPILQNWTHVNAVKQISNELKKAAYFPIVVFSGNATLKGIKATTPVIKNRKLLRTIKQHQEICFSHEQLTNINFAIEEALIYDKKIIKDHLRQVKTTIHQKRNKPQVVSKTCPRCGSSLQVKSGKYGQFYGCTNYPVCRFTKNMS